MTDTSMQDLANQIKSRSLGDIATDRVGAANLEAVGWKIDLSRHFLNLNADAALLKFAEQRELSGAIDALFQGEVVNPSEGRPALHWALRQQTRQSGLAETVRQSTADALSHAGELTTGQRAASNGQPFKAILHIGIGGSDFGPRLVVDAFCDNRRDQIDLRFCANLDPLDLEIALRGLNPAETLIIGVSKSFGTEETLYNLSRARDWLKSGIGDSWAAHFVLVTANLERAQAWSGSDRCLGLCLPESVGGRFSIWSAGSLACMTVLEGGVFEHFLAGAADMDHHVRHAPLFENAAVRLALLDYWNTSILGFGARAVLAYSRRLRLLPPYLQQLEMESNGKSVGPSGEMISAPTAPLLWGGEGTIGQHSYHQWLHQGTHVMPTEFILAPGSRSDALGTEALAAHALAQAEVLANGRSLADVQADEPHLPAYIAAQKAHAGGRPSTLLYTELLTPRALGALIALYEHRTYLAGVLWGVNSFDQWGVERGKTMAASLKPVLSGQSRTQDPVTEYLAEKIARDFALTKAERHL